MEMQKIASIGDKVDLKQIVEDTLKDEKIPVYPSQILDIKENNVLQLSMPYYEGRIVPLSVNDKYEVCIYAKNGLYVCNSIIIERYKTQNMFYMDVAVYTDLKKIQRREYYRYTYRTNIEFRIVTEKIISGEAIESYEDQKKATWYNGIMMDLSGGGLRMVSSVELDKGTLMEFRFPITTPTGEEMVTIHGRQLRSQRMEGNPNLRDNRVEFINVDKVLQEKIIRFIFEKERESLSMGKK